MSKHKPPSGWISAIDTTHETLECIRTALEAGRYEVAGELFDAIAVSTGRAAEGCKVLLKLRAERN